MWHPHILSYRKQLSLGSGGSGSDSKAMLPAMGVAVMTMLNPTSSGVLFTLNPTTGNTKQMVVERYRSFLPCERHTRG
jgi:phosphoenolpyruvate synthase/pyruvate phosphate dikinase